MKRAYKWGYRSLEGRWLETTGFYTDEAALRQDLKLPFQSPLLKLEHTFITLKDN